ncbi:unnamed protein product [Ilex paraguariensis]|uniref:Uncharacterized protein n=1 Tax=Ilex paraguariensis TaxID=185542 RepID=A0ABC8URE7_9AQUA
MAKSIAALVLLVLLLSIFSLLIPSGARVLWGLRATRKDIGSQHLLMSKLGFSPMEVENYQRWSLNVGSDKVSPGGPDGQSPGPGKKQYQQQRMSTNLAWMFGNDEVDLEEIFALWLP